MLRDCVVCSIADGRLQQCLLAEPGLTLKKALELAQVQETADQGAQHLQQKQPQSGQMNNLTKSRLTIVSREAKKKQAVRDEQVSYLRVAPL